MTVTPGARLPAVADARSDQDVGHDQGLGPAQEDGATEKALASGLDADLEVRDREGLGTLDTGRPHPARVYDYWLGGRDNFAADRDAGARVAKVAPWVISGARGNRAFLTRAVAWLARAGVDQFLDLGSGLPTAQNVHEVAHAVTPGARTVYVDRDPLVLAHARALLARDERTLAVAGDVRDPGAILDDPGVRAHLDLDRPVAVLLLAMLHFVVDDDEAARMIAVLRERLLPGSYLALSHVADFAGSSDPVDSPGLVDSSGRPGHGDAVAAARAAATRRAAELYDTLAGPFTLRAPETITAWFDGLDLVPPGLVPAHTWRPRRRRPGPPVPLLVGVARLPDPAAETGAETPAIPGEDRGSRAEPGSAERDVSRAVAWPGGCRLSWDDGSW